jgi:hypothetical protein
MGIRRWRWQAVTQPIYAVNSRVGFIRAVAREIRALPCQMLTCTRRVVMAAGCGYTAVAHSP